MIGNRGVSDVISFVLVFSLVASAVGVISVYGFDMLQTVKDDEQLKNGERAFDVLADNLADIHETGAPSRVTEIDVEGAQITAGSTVTVNLTGVRPGGPNPENVFTFEPIVYSGNGEAAVVYAAGAMFRVQRQGGVVVLRPPFLIESDRVLFPIVQTAHRGETSSYGGDTMQIRAEMSQRQPIGGFTDNATTFEQLVVNMTTPRTVLWSRYFEKQPQTTCRTPRPGNLRCTIANTDGDTLFASRTLIEYRFET
jgi:hypothetical protein